MEGGISVLLTRNYELMFILDPELSAEETQTLLDRIQGYLTEADGQLLHIEDWGVRRLAYAIQHRKEGHYYLLYFSMDSVKVPTFERNLLLVESIMREIIVRTETVPEKRQQVLPQAPTGEEETAPVEAETATSVEESNEETVAESEAQSAPESEGKTEPEPTVETEGE